MISQHFALLVFINTLGFYAISAYPYDGPTTYESVTTSPPDIDDNEISEAELNRQEGTNLFESDILVPYGKGGDDRLADVGVILWPNGKIPYVISTTDFDTAQQNMIKQAINEYNEKTGLQWIPRTNEPDYVDIIDSDSQKGCWSNYLGRSPNGGRQMISLHKRFKSG